MICQDEVKIIASSRGQDSLPIPRPPSHRREMPRLLSKCSVPVYQVRVLDPSAPACLPASLPATLRVSSVSAPTRPTRASRLLHLPRQSGEGSAATGAIHLRCSDSEQSRVKASLQDQWGGSHRTLIARHFVDEIPLMGRRDNGWWNKGAL